MASPSLRSLPDMPDVLYHVFFYLDPIYQFERDKVYESRRSLAVAARTCRGFTGPALDVLWRRLPDDQPLANLLCEVGIGTKEGDGKVLELVGENKPRRYELPRQGVVDLRHAFAEEEYERRWRLSRGYDIRYHLLDVPDPRKHPGWPRFVEYASRVRSLTLFAFDSPGWCGIWEELRSRTDGAPILPKLLTVAFCRISWGTLNSGAFALISPSVCKLNFSLGYEYIRFPVELQEKLRCVFSQTFTAAPEIHRLRSKSLPSHLSSPLLQAQCSRIRHLKVHPHLVLDELRLLTELPALQYLSILLPRQDFPEANPSFRLKSVTILDVEGTWLNLNMLLHTVGLPSLHTLSLTGAAYGKPAAELVESATQCFRTISTKHPSLTSLSISTSHGRVRAPRGCRASYGIPEVRDTFETSFLDLVHPLFSLSALRHLSLVLPSYFDFTCTTADLRAVAESFRFLEAFHLDIRIYGSTTQRDSGGPPRGGPLDAIVHFARSCPNLRLLHLPGMEMAEGFDGELEDHEHPNEPHGLRTLIVPSVLLPPGRADLAGKVSELVKGFFPLAECTLRSERVIVSEGRASVDGRAAPCPGCFKLPAKIKLIELLASYSRMYT